MGDVGESDVLQRFQALSDTVDTERTFGIESNGLALLAAYCFEVLQEIHYFKEPKVKRAPGIIGAGHGADGTAIWPVPRAT